MGADQGCRCTFQDLVYFVVSPPKPLVSEQVPCVVSTGVGSEEQQRDSVSPHSADSPMSISSPQQHSSSSSVSSLSGSDNVRTHTHLVHVAYVDYSVMISDLIDGFMQI